MKKITFIILAALLLFSCNAVEDENSYNSFALEDYQSKAHDALENSANDASGDESLNLSSNSGISDEDLSAEASSNDASSSTSDTTSDESLNTSDLSDIDLSKDDISADTSAGQDIPTVAPAPEIMLVTVDIAYEDGTAATLVCGNNGSVDLFFGNGYEMKDMGKMEDCREQGAKLLNACKTHFNAFKAVEEFPFPESGTTFVYIKTENGVYKLAYDNTQILLGAEGDIEICVRNTITNVTKYAPE